MVTKGVEGGEGVSLSGGASMVVGCHLRKYLLKDSCLKTDILSHFALLSLPQLISRRVMVFNLTFRS